MSKLNWQTVPQAELSQLLKQAELDASRAVGAATVYQLTIAGGREVLAISLPDGQALVVEATVPAKLDRRKNPLHESPPP